jgi:hypothetical protein
MATSMDSEQRITVRRKRAFKPKVTTGCMTCKCVACSPLYFSTMLSHADVRDGSSRKRRIKCDEAKPSCKRCIKYGQLTNGYRLRHNYKCPGYSTLPSTRRKPLKYEATSTSERKPVSCERALELDGSVSRIIQSISPNTKLDGNVPSLSYNHLGSTSTASEHYTLPLRGLSPTQSRENILPLTGVPVLTQGQIHDGQKSLGLVKPRDPFIWSTPMSKRAPLLPRERSFSRLPSASSSSSCSSPHMFSEQLTDTTNSFPNSSRQASSCTMSVEAHIEDPEEKLWMRNGNTCSPGPEYMVSNWNEKRSSEGDSLRERERRMQEIVYRVRGFSLDSPQTGKGLHKAPITSHPQRIIDLGAGSGCWANRSL